jgi:hypothetical protein
MKGGHKANHHGKQKASGGRIGMVASGNPDVIKEAKGKEPYAKHGGRIEGAKAHHRPDHKPRGRKRGGGVGADRSPLSSAHSAKGGDAGSSDPRDTYGGTPS